MSNLDSRKAEIAFRLHAKQGVAIETPATEVLYGGAAGAGKSLLMRAAAIMWCGMIPGLQVYLFRRLRDDLVKNHIEGPQGLRMLLAPWVRGGLVDIVEDEIRFWNGSKIYLCHCKDEKDRFKYLGAEIHVLLIDELTTFTDTIYRFLRSRVRMAGVVLPPEFVGRFPRILCGSNPGNVGHGWVKAAFIDARPPLQMERVSSAEGGMLRQFIPAKLADNPSLDPVEYGEKLEGLGSPALVKAMRDGDWNVVVGAFFPEFSTEIHVIEPRSLPAYWQRFRAFDWGSARPFSVGWYAVSDGELPEFPRGALIRYREWYGAAKDVNGATVPNVGLRLTAEEIADGIAEREKDDVYGNRVMAGVADPSIFSEDGGPSHADRMAARKVFFRPADNARVARLGAMGGWDQLRARLKGDGERPALFIFSTCLDLIRTLPALQHDDGRPEDINCWVPGTMISTPAGSRPIEDICEGDMVDTPIGARVVLRSYVSGTSETVRVSLSDGRVLEGTAAHKIAIWGGGLVALSSVIPHMIPTERIIWSRALSIAVSFIVAMRGAVTITRMARTLLKERYRAFIGKCGWMHMGLFQRAMISTTGTTTMITMPSITSSACMNLNTTGSTCLSGWPGSWGSKSLRGERLMKAAQSFVIMREKCARVRLNGNVRADIVALLLLRSMLPSVFALSRVVSALTCLSNWCARFAAMGLRQSGTQKSKQERVHITAVGHSAVKVLVYNLTVADAHMFYANGILSSNTESEDHAGDELRYACASRPYTAPLPPSASEAEPDGYARRWKPSRGRGRGSAMSA